MADDALFFGWGEVVRGRETKAVEVFNEAVAYYGQLQQDGKLEGFEAYFLGPHGGDLGGFFLLHGEREALHEIERSEEFERLQTRVTMIVDGSGAVPAVTGEALARQMGHFEEAAKELGG
jgi:hypothetical protein